MPSTNARILRAVATAVVVFSIAAGAHVAGGAVLPSPLILAALGASTLLAVTVLARRQLSLAELLGILGAGQLALHQAFTMLTTTAACVAAPRGHFGPQQVHCAPAGAMEHAHAFVMFDSPGMLGAHTASVVLTALMLFHGESTLKLALRWLRPLAMLPPVGAFPPSVDLPPAPKSPVRNYLHPLLSIRPLRGPPLSTSH